MCPSSSVRASIIWIGTPRAPKIEAYSHPMTPAPITAREFGVRSRLRIESLSKIDESSKGISGGLYGEEPVAIRMISPRMISLSPPRSTTISWALAKLAVP